MTSTHVDLLVIGWGKGGKTLARQAALRGESVILVEQSADMVGGTCINIGCVPSKALVHDAEQRRADDDAQTTFAAAMARRAKLTGAMRARNFELVDEVPGATPLIGRARFTGPRTVEVATADGTTTITADTVCINTGATPRLPQVPGAVIGGRVHDSTSLQQLTRLPERLVVVGAGAIGLEFASMFAQFGAEVTLLHRGERLLAGEEPEAATAALGALTDAGVRVVTDATLVRLDDGAETAAVTWRDAAGDEHTARAEAVLLATGRRAAVDELNLAAGGIELDDRGFIRVDERLHTSAEGVVAVGDVNGGPQHTYISFDDARVVASERWGDGSRTVSDRRAVPAVTYLTPPLARAGITVQEARDRGLRVLVASKPVAAIAAMPRPKIDANPRGHITILADAETDQLLGATLMHVGADEVINLLVLAMRHGITASEVRDGIYTHPSSTEALNEVLAGLTPLE